MRRLDFYRDNQTDYLLARIKARYSQQSWKDFYLFSINLVRKITDKRAMVYMEPPVRTFEGMNQETGDQFYRDMAANITLKKANRYTRLFKTTALKVGWNGNAPTLSVVTPNILDAFYSDPEIPDRIIVTNPGKTEQETTYSDWTSTEFVKRNAQFHPVQNKGNGKNINPYGIIPFVPCFDYAPDDEFFLRGGDDLFDAQNAVNVALVNLWRTVEVQAHGQPYIIGSNDDEQITTGPSTVIKLPHKGEFGFAAPNGPIEETLKAIEFVIKQTAVANDLAANVFELDPKAESGAAKRAEQSDLIEARKDDVELWRSYERKLFEVIKRVVNTHKPGAIPEDATVAIDFGEIADPVSEKDRMAGYRQRLDMGVWSPVDVLMADNPDIRTREDAMTVLNERREEAAVLGIPFAGPTFQDLNND